MQTELLEVVSNRCRIQNKYTSIDYNTKLLSYFGVNVSLVIKKYLVKILKFIFKLTQHHNLKQYINLCLNMKWT